MLGSIRVTHLQAIGIEETSSDRAHDVQEGYLESADEGDHGGLVFAQEPFLIVRLEEAEAVDDAKGGEVNQHRAEHVQPALQAALGIVRRRRGG